MWLSYEYAGNQDQDLTPQERAERKRAYTRRHLALVRACMEVDAFLKGHGVIGMLRGQGERGSMNSALVAVLGLAVKKQEVGYGLFTTPAGHAHLTREFTRYYALSPEVAALDARIAAAAAALAQATQALRDWEPPDRAP